LTIRNQEGREIAGIPTQRTLLQPKVGGRVAPPYLPPLSTPTPREVRAFLLSTGLPSFPTPIN
jgi:hypothetical protein